MDTGPCVEEVNNICSGILIAAMRIIRTKMRKSKYLKKIPYSAVAFLYSAGIFYMHSVDIVYEYGNVSTPAVSSA